MGRRVIAINDDGAPAFARRYSIETRSLPALTRRYRKNLRLTQPPLQSARPRPIARGLRAG